MTRKQNDPALLVDAEAPAVTDFETVHVAIRDGVVVSGRALAGLPESAHIGLNDQRSVTVRYDAGAILPAGVRPDVLDHLEHNGLVLAIHVPITTTTDPEES